jgi:hypothetical protein
MTRRDRTVLIVVVVFILLGGAWMLVVSPKRNEANKLGAQVAEAKTQLASAESQLTQGHAAQSRYAKAYASIVSLGKAVPASQEIPSLIYQVTLASKQKKVDFSSIALSGSGSGGGSGAASGAAAAAAGSPAGSGAASMAGGLSQMPFTFVFNGTFFDLEHLFQHLSRFIVRDASGGLQVSGRLLTMQSVRLVPAATGATPSSGPQQLAGTITATAYVMPPAQGLTSGVPPAATAPVTSTTGASSSPTAPAAARVTP